MQLLRNTSTLLLLLAGIPRLALCVSCPVAAPHVPSAAEMAFLQSDYDRATSLYNEALQQKPNDPELTAGLTKVLLRQQKVEEANDLVKKALSVNPSSAVLETALGFVQYRAGAPWLASDSAIRATRLDPCYAQTRLLNVMIMHLTSLDKSAADELKTAHMLNPYDPEVRAAWLQTLPVDERIQAAEDYLRSPNRADPEQKRRLGLYLETLKKIAARPKKSCQLTSSDNTTELPFARIMRDATHVRAYGLEVKLNGHNARLEIDTGAGGLVIGHSVAKQAGLERFSATEVGGVGAGGDRAAFTSYVESIKIGSLEFHDCAVTVIENRDLPNVDGLIGMNVFSNLLVTLDYPMRKVTLGKLPPRPQEASGAKPSLETDAEENAENANSGADANPQGFTTGSAIGPQNRYVAAEMQDWTRVYRVGHHLIIPAVLNQTVSKLFILDTGAFSTTISPAAAAEVTKVHKSYDIKVRGLSGMVDKVYATGEITFDFANLRQPALGVVAFDTSNISKNAGLEVSGFIGITTLGQLRVKLDYRDALVKFEYDPKRGYRSVY